MSFEEVKSAVTNMTEEQQRQLVAYLVRLRDARDPQMPEEIARKIHDKNPAHWVPLEELREHWKE